MHFPKGTTGVPYLFSSKTAQTRQKQVAVPVTKNASVTLQPKIYGYSHAAKIDLKCSCKRSSFFRLMKKDIFFNDSDVQKW